MTPLFFSTKVVGVSFHEEYPTNILRLVDDLYAFDTVPARLVRDYSNPYDANAIRVKIDGDFVGHLPKLIAASLAPDLDAGKQWVAEVEAVLINDGKVQQPGLKLKVWRVEK